MKVSQRLFRIHLVWISLLSLTFRFLVPPNPGYGAVHDDELMVTMAHNIMETGWIGNYSELGHLLLSKPPGLSMFLAHTHFLPWAPTVTIHALLLMGFLLFLREVRAFGVPRQLVTAMYVMVAFFPDWYN